MTKLEPVFNLGPMDYIVSSTLPIEAVFIYRKPSSLSSDQFIDPDRLKDATSHLLDYYPHLTGRLQLNSMTHTPEIAHLGAGVDFLEASCSTTLRDIASSSLSGLIITPMLPGYGAALLPFFDSAVESVSRNAICAIQHTRFLCGGVGLGIRVHHRVCDAQGFLQIMRDLAEIYRQLRDSSPPNLISPPEIRSHFRDFTKLSPNTKTRTLSFKPSAFPPQVTPGDSKESPNLIKPSVFARVLYFSGEDLTALKQAATNPDPKSGTWVSTFEALSAYLYQKIYQAKVQVMEQRGISLQSVQCQPLREFWTTMDLRDPCRLNLPPRYFANAVHCTSAYASHENLMRGPLWYIAHSIHYAIRSVDMDHVRRQFEWIAAQPDQSCVELTQEFPEGALAVVQWTRENIYARVDFEVRANGKPILPALVSPPLRGSYLLDGLAMVISAEAESCTSKGERNNPTGSHTPCALYVNLALNELIWSFLERDINFVSHIC